MIDIWRCWARSGRYIHIMPAKPGSRLGPARVFQLGTEPLDDLRATTTAEERLEMVAVLSARMRELTGLPDEALRRDRVVIRPLHQQ